MTTLRGNLMIKQQTQGLPVFEQTHMERAEIANNHWYVYMPEGDLDFL